MKCPTCFSTMKCISEIHKVPGQPGKERMDLHCYNRTNDRQPNICKARTHMGVITEDPKPWVCIKYSFEFRKDNKLYYLSSVNSFITPYNNYSGKTKLESAYDGKEIYSLPYFMPISTGDDMHEEAWELFRRLEKLAIYS